LWEKIREEIKKDACIKKLWGREFYHIEKIAYIRLFHELYENNTLDSINFKLEQTGGILDTKRNSCDRLTIENKPIIFMVRK